MSNDVNRHVHDVALQKPQKQRSAETPRIYVFWGAIQYFAGQRYTLTKLQTACNFYIVFAGSLTSIDSEKDTKLRAHTVNLAFKLRSFVG